MIQNLANNDEALVIRYAALLRGTESAWQALSYGLEALTIFQRAGGVYMNFALWAIAIAPGWLVVRHFGVDMEDSASTTSSPAEPASEDHKEEHIK